jgi:predicted RNA-binding protein with PIN domain
MPILIDGYNLISAVGIMGRGVGPGSLERARLALLNFLAESLDTNDIGRTTVVFDAKNAPAGLPRIVTHRGLTVHFASRYPDADSLIEELITKETSPRNLTVVSSDHRIQRAARRRRAIPIDSDVWYQGILNQRRRRQDTKKSKRAEAKPPVPLLEEDVDYWIRQFGGESAIEEFLAEKLCTKEEPPVSKSDKADPDADSSAAGENNPQAKKAKSNEDPFPPGYADDLLEKGDIDSDTYNPFPPGYGEDLENPGDLGNA